ncbi:hypothetical protein DFH11DRAFT_1547893 [Phellopilus nigrolimitatus]|nr:hypothetical protein DFH11DRAFT_1547893 [Phellopilus nigrolimitatus]
MQVHTDRRPRRQDTFDLRNQIHPDDTVHAHQHYAQAGLTSDSEHSVMEDSSDADGEDVGQDSMDVLENSYGAERDHDIDPDGHESDDAIGDYMSDSSSSLSIPNESIDFDLVYSLTNFAATVEGQASVVKGDSLFLMDDSNSYWWLVRVLKTQEVGYIPAENIETPFERLARLNRHRNVDLASATQAEMDSANPAAAKSTRNRNRVHIAPVPETDAGEKRAVAFRPSSSVFRYPPAVWNEEDEEADEEWDDDDIEVEDAPVKDETGQVTAGDGDIVQIDRENDEQAPAAQKQNEDVPMTWEGPDNGPQASVPAALRPGDAGIVAAQSSADVQPQQQVKAEPQQQLRSQTSRERLLAQQESQAQVQQDADRLKAAQQGRDTSPMLIDPAEVTETKKLVITPSVARDEPAAQPKPQQTQKSGPGPLLPSAIIEKRQQELEQERKRTREEIEAAEEAARKRATKGRELGHGPPPAQQQKEIVRSASQETRSSVGSGGSGNGKLRKERIDKEKEAEESEKDGKEKKKKSGVFAGLFGRKKDKEKSGKASIENMAAVAAADTRHSEDSGVSSVHSQGQTQLTASPLENGRGAHSPGSGVRPQPQQRSTSSPVQQQAAQQTQSPYSQAVSPPPQTQSTQQQPQPVSLLRERDQQQQALYQQYLKRSPSSPPDQPSYATQSASLVMPTQGPLNSSPNNSGFGLGLAPVNASFRTQGGRPGSLLLSPASGADGQSGFGVPELSVIRVFAGVNLQSDATFKTVLLNTSTSASELVRQAMQRFRLAAGEDAKDYYLTVKQVEGSSLKLNPEEKPLGVFEQLVEEAMEMPKVKRSSMGSISSIASNLSAHPAIRKLPMNDFTDDSAVKFYLNRRGGEEDGGLPYDDEDSLAADTTLSGDSDTSLVIPRSNFRSAASAGLNSVSPERFSSPSVRFALQLAILPDELPDNMVFDPHTEAIVFKETLRDRSQSSATVNPGISQIQRKKFFNFPKNITVAEVIELGLERFGILEGVVDGGDEVEDKLTKRRSSSRVRYTLAVQVDGQERELPPSSKVVDAFPRPPIYRRSGELKRRSVDSAQLLLGTMDDIQEDDPVFVLRRAVAYRATSTSRHHRLSAPLDELALSHLHRDSSASDSSAGGPEEPKSRQPSRQEIIAAQRAASRANQKAMLSTQANAQRGVDVMLPDKGMLRSQRYDTDNRMRYSYVQPDGETYDISDIVEEEFKVSDSTRSMTTSSSSGSTNDLLSGVLNGAQPNALINRVLSKINGMNGPVSQSNSASTFRSSPSMYSEDTQSDGGSRAATPTASTVAALRSAAPTTTKDAEASRSRSVTPTAAGPASNQTHRYQPSIESVMSDTSDYRTAASGTPLAMASTRAMLSPSPPPPPKKPRIPKDEFGLTEMLAIIDSRAMLNKPPPSPPLDEVDKLFFGSNLDAEKMHPQIRDVYAGTFKKMKELDAELETLLQKSLRLF